MNIFDADKFVPKEKRLFKLGGKTFDVTVMPAYTSILCNHHRDVLSKMTNGEVTKDGYDILVEILLTILSRLDSEVDGEYIKRHLDAGALGGAILFLLAPLYKVDESGEGEKKSSHIEASHLEESLQS